MESPSGSPACRRMPAISCRRSGAEADQWREDMQVIEVPPLAPAANFAAILRPAGHRGREADARV